MSFPGNELLALLVAVSFAAGLNVYATVATLGLLAHANLLALPPQLHLLSNWWIIAAAGTLFAVEFFADKVPAFDLLWNVLHTFVRVPVAALLAWQATSALSPGEQLALLSLADSSPSSPTPAKPLSDPSSPHRPSRSRTCRSVLVKMCSPSALRGSPPYIL
jgi:hypothetical protein